MADGITQTPWFTPRDISDDEWRDLHLDTHPEERMGTPTEKEIKEMLSDPELEEFINATGQHATVQPKTCDAPGDETRTGR